MRKLAAASVLAFALSSQLGCGGVYYAVSVNAAQSKLEQAREMGAEQATPYEYHYAREHLREAQLHASEASYGDAATYAETAELYAQKAIDLIQAAKRGEARSDGKSRDKESSGGGDKGSDKEKGEGK